ncbi:MAG: MFS transporter [Gemmatimonadaceae bacterium]|nr:MFS transporter [Gemmatimonadaceae bacterium]
MIANAGRNPGDDAVVVAEDAAFRRVTRRLIPLLFVSYIVAYLDRVNIGFAKLQMAESLALSDAVYGFGAGVFFLGYFLFEVPSNLMLERVGARLWIARIMITWGIVSAAFAGVDVIPWGPLPALFGMPRSQFSFYALRFVLGMAEAGFFPGIILYLTYWYPAARRGQAVALFMTAVAVANVFGGPLSGAIMQYADGARGWAGWRWLFVLEALPSVVMGFVLLALLPDGPARASWLTPAQRDVIGRALAAERTTDAPHRPSFSGVLQTMANRRVWGLAFVYLTFALTLYGVNFWMPTIIQELGIARTDYLRVGLVSMIPWGLAGVVMVWAGAHSDKTGERRWHAALSLLCAALGLLGLAVVGHAPIPSVIALTMVACGTLACASSFWSLATNLLGATAAATGIAWINSIGNLGGHFGPDLIGRIRTTTGSSSIAFFTLAALAASGAAVTLWVSRPTAAERSSSTSAL